MTNNNNNKQNNNNFSVLQMGSSKPMNKTAATLENEESKYDG